MEFAQGRPNGSKTAKVMFEVRPYFQNRLNHVSAGVAPTAADHSQEPDTSNRSTQPDPRRLQMASNSNRGVVYLKPGSVEVQKIDFPSFRNPAGKAIDHGVILKVVTTNICGSDQHMVRGRTTAPAGMVLGHEITGEVIEKGRDVEYLEIGDLVSVPFNVACGRCRTCR
jgi:hypothetical protein